MANTLSRQEGTTMTTQAAIQTSAPHYRPPGWATRQLMNRAVRALTRLGVSVWGSRILEVPGRRTGAIQRVPVNLLDHAGQRYLVAPRGTTQWVRNVRANEGHLDLVLGRRRTAVVAIELDEADKVEVLRAYLARWKAEVGAFFDGVDDASSDVELAAVAPRHPVFALVDTEARDEVER
jgi:deazaflavin-dependent oxidoreductase (nitroreductase family)